MPAGHDDPRFQAAVEAWLEADDEGSVPELAALAQSGNVAAQILLSRLERKTGWQSTWRAELSGSELKELFNVDGEHKRTEWLALAAQTSQLLYCVRDLNQEILNFSPTCSDGVKPPLLNRSSIV